MKKRAGILFLMLTAVIAFSACTKKPGDESQAGSKTNDVSIEEIHNAVKSAYGEDYIPNMPYDAAALKEQFEVEEGWCEEYVAEGPMISAHVDTFIAIKAKNGKEDDVEEALNKYRDGLLEDTMQYPSNQAKIQASRVLSYGNYVFFVMLGSIPLETEEQGEEAMLSAFEEQNQIAVTAIEGLLLKK